MISRGACNLYQKFDEWNGISISIYKSGKIKTCWFTRSKEKRAEYVKKTYKKRYGESKQIMHELKINGCAICGYSECDAALDFHHANPQDKKFRISLSHIDYKANKIINELNKCILLCSNCHREIHDKERIK